MSGALTASFRLTLQDEASAGVQSLDALFGRMNETLDRLASALAPLERLAAPLTRATEIADRLDRALGGSASAASRAAEAGRGAATAFEGLSAAFTQAAWQATDLSVNLGAVGGAAGTAGAEGEEMGAEIAGGAARATTALDGLLARLREIRTTMGGVAAAGMGAAGGAFGGLRDAGRGFSDSLQHSMHHGMTAAMATVGMLEPIHAAAEYDNTLTHIGIGDDLHGAANRAFVSDYGRWIDVLARATGQRGVDLAEGAGFFNREGYSQDRINAVMPTVARIATAYNAAPDAIARTTFALQENMRIGDNDLGGALSSVALAGKSADLPFERLAPLFPEVAAAAGALGVHGRSGVNDLAAMLAVMRKNTGTEGEATTNARAFMQAITSPHTAHRFAGYGIDLFGLINHARATDGDPIDAVLRAVNRVSSGGRDLRVLGTLFNNQQDRAFTQALLTHMDQYQQIHSRVASATPTMIGQDYDTGLQSTQIRLQAFEEAIAQLNRRIGEGFVPTLNVMTGALHGVIDGWDWLDKHMPGVTTGITGTIGATLGLTASIAALGVVAAPLRAGWKLIPSSVRTGLVRLMSPLRRVFGLFRLLPAAFGAVRTGLAALGGPFTVLAAVAIAAIGDIALHWDRFSAAFSAIGHGHVLAGGFAVIRQLFMDFVHWLDGWTGGLPSRILAGITAEWHVLTDGLAARLHQVETTFDHSWLGQHLGFAAPVPAPAVAVPVAGAAAGAVQPHRVDLHVSADRGLTVRHTGGQAPGLTIAQPNTGRMVGRP